MKTNYNKFEMVCQILKKNNFDKSKLIPILQDVQKEYKYLPEEVLAFISSSLNISPAKVYGVATFFAHFTLEPRGKYVIRVCDGTACHVKKSSSLIDSIKNRLNLKENERSTKDMVFTLETVSCLGACGLAPVVLIGDDVYGQITPDKLVRLIDEIMRREETKW
ncbi:MAG: NAD(P)H-dependent oxidoreductase subunit E [Endomicrobium sp.]|jgi:NADH-quinone oxidoreductase subunit E|nr:NAD(P)H-dependent oxidoreductase subunit E [Endomicrobium sp.]